MINKKYLYIILGSVILIIFLLWLLKQSSQDIVVEPVDLTPQNVQPVVTQTVYDAIELKSQADFKIVGDMIYSGGGFEPGWGLKISLAGTKFGTDITTQYGDGRYVGYLDITSQSTTSKTFSGKMLDIKNKVVDGTVTLLSKKCGKPSGEFSDYTATVKVGKEKLSGCVDIAIAKK